MLTPAPHPSHWLLPFYLIRADIASTCARTMPQESQEGPVIPQQDRPYLQRWAPFVLKNVQADAPKFVNVRVVDLCYEPNLHA